MTILELEYKKILLFSTLNPYPFWAGSENFWFDFVMDDRINRDFIFQVVLADSPVTRKKAVSLSKKGVKTKLYKHFNVHFARRNIYRVIDKLKRSDFRTLPWYNEISRSNYDLVWFNVATLADLADLSYAVQQCKKKRIPYWVIIQHGYEDFFLHSQKEMETVANVVDSAKRIIFISQRNRGSLERALCRKLNNAFHSVNALPGTRILEAIKYGEENPVNSGSTAKFFNLGRFSPKDKAQHLLLEAFASDEWKKRNWQLSFIGVSHSGQVQLEKLRSFYGLEKDRIRIKEHTEKVFAEIVQHDILLMPSLSEGTPFAMIESMACARPALGTPVGGIPELITDGQTGWLAATTSLDDIKKALGKAWDQKEHWKQFGKNAQQRILESYNQEQSFTQLADLLAQDTK